MQSDKILSRGVVADIRTHEVACSWSRENDLTMGDSRFGEAIDCGWAR
jgi:hypothetical protein